MRISPNHLRRRREKVFQGFETRLPLDREAKVRIMHLARCLKRRTEPHKHYGVLTGKFVDVLHALLWLIHDGKSGQCNPSYETIALKAGCVRSTVALAIAALERCGVLSWANRITRVRIRERDLFGHWTSSWRVLRTSNAYVFHDPKASKSEVQPGPLDSRFKREKARLDGASARVITAPGGPSGWRQPPLPAIPPRPSG